MHRISGDARTHESGSGSTRPVRSRAVAAFLAAALLASVLALAPSPTAFAADPVCGCTGEFQDPKVTRALVVGAAPANAQTGLSKTGRYRVIDEYDQGSQSGQIRVVRADSGAELVTFPLDGSANGWGFSPDEDRFVRFGHSSAELYDLASGGTQVLGIDRPATIGFSPKGTYALAVWPEGNTAYASVHHAATGEVIRFDGSDRLRDSQYLGFGPDDRSIFVENTTTRTSSLYSLPGAERIFERTGNPSTVGYSPDGSHVSVAVLDGGTVHVTVLRTTDGHPVYETTFSAIAPPIISEPDPKTGKLKLDPQEAGGLGFSPDGGTYLVGTSDGSTARVTVVDLASGQEVLEVSNITGKATWQFSPCGHMFVLVSQATPDSRPEVEVRSTADGSLLGTTDVPVGSVTLRSTADEVVVDHEPDGALESTVLAPNLVCAVFSLALPATIVGGSSATGTLTLDRPAPPGGLPLALSTSSPHLTLPANVLVPAGQTSVPVEIGSTPPPGDVDVTVTMRTSGRYQSEPVTLTVKVTGIGLSDLRLDDWSVRGGETTTGTVTLSDPAPAGGLSVALTSNDPSARVPTSVTVAEGERTADFVVETDLVEAPVEVTVTATLGGASRTAWLGLEPTFRTTTELVAVPSPWTIAGAKVTLTAHITAVVPDDGGSYPGPSGTVTFTSGGVTLGEVDVEGSWAETEAFAVFVTDPLGPGTHDISATYSGGEDLQGSEASVSITAGSGTHWTGAGDGVHWSDPANWAGSQVPAPGGTVAISVDEPAALVNDVAGLRLDHLFLEGTILLTGAPIELDGSLSAVGEVRVDNDLSLADGLRSVAAHGRLSLRGVISGGGGLAFAGGTVDLGGAPNTYAGATTIARHTQVRLFGPDALGSRSSGTEVHGALCIGPLQESHEPITARGGQLNPCVELLGDEVDVEEVERLIDSGSLDVLGTFAGPVEVDGRLRLACRDRLDADPELFAHLGIDGPISGTGAVELCGGGVRFGGTEANSYTGHTTVGHDGNDGDGAATALELAKPDGVLAVPGSISGHRVSIAADGQLAAEAELALRSLHLGTHETEARHLEVGTLVVGTDDLDVGQVRVSGIAAVDTVELDVTADVPPATTSVVVSKTSPGPMEHCPAGAIARGSAVIDHRVSCTGGDGNDLALTAVWHTEVSLEIDPPSSSPRTGQVTMTVTVSAPPGAPTATGQVDLWRHGHSGGRWRPSVQLATLDLVDGRATATFPGDQLDFRTAFTAEYFGTSTHASASSPLQRYVLWNVQAPSLPEPPTAVRVTPEPWGPSAYVEWTRPPVPMSEIVAFHIDVETSGGDRWTVSTATLAGDWSLPYLDYPAFGFYRVEGLQVGETYTFRVRTLNTRGSSEASDPVTVTLGEPDDDGDGDDGDDEDIPTVPGPPTGLVATPGPGQLTLRWSAPADDGGRPIEGYVITPHRDGVALDPVTTPSATLSYTLGDLDPSASYTFTVAARNAVGTGAASRLSDPVAPEAPAPIRTAPTAPRGVGIDGEGTDVVLRWTPPADDGGTPITSYRVERRLWRYNPIDGEAFEGPWSPTIVSGDRTSLAMSLPEITWPWTVGQYRFRVVAINDVGEGPWSAEVTLDAVYRPRDTFIPPPPFNPDDLPLPPIPPHGDLSNTTGPGTSSLLPGQSSEVTAAGFDPGEAVRLELHSTPVHLGDTVADEEGVVRARFTVPIDTPPGPHTLHLIGLTSGQHVSFPLEVLAPRADAAATGPLPRTGGEVELLLTLGWALVAFGALTLTTRRRTQAC